MGVNQARALEAKLVLAYGFGVCLFATKGGCCAPDGSPGGGHAEWRLSAWDWRKNRIAMRRSRMSSLTSVSFWSSLPMPRITVAAFAAAAMMITMPSGLSPLSYHCTNCAREMWKTRWKTCGNRVDSKGGGEVIHTNPPSLNIVSTGFPHLHVFEFTGVTGRVKARARAREFNNSNSHWVAVLGGEARAREYGHEISSWPGYWWPALIKVSCWK